MLCIRAAGYLFLQYDRDARQPIREPPDVSAGDVVGREWIVTERSGTVRAPTSGAAVPAVHWRVDRWAGGTQTAWSTDAAWPVALGAALRVSGGEDDPGVGHAFEAGNATRL